MAGLQKKMNVLANRARGRHPELFSVTLTPQAISKSRVVAITTRARSILCGFNFENISYQHSAFLALKILAVGGLSGLLERVPSG